MTEESSEQSPTKRMREANAHAFDFSFSSKDAKRIADARDAAAAKQNETKRFKNSDNVSDAAKSFLLSGSAAVGLTMAFYRFV